MIKLHDHRQGERMRASAAACLIALACSPLGCWSSSSSSQRATGAAGPITLYDTHHQVIARLAPDGTITDGAAHTVSRYDSSSHSMTLVGTTLDISQSVHRLGPNEMQVQVGPLGPWRVRVSANAVEVDGHPFGFIEGFDGSDAEMTRVGALMCVVPVVEPPAPAASQPPSAPDAASPPPPPPPPKTDR
jgi:hypothetical protein